MIRCTSRRLAKIVQLDVVSQVQSIDVSLISKKKTNKENHANQKNLQNLTRISQAVDSPVKSDQSKIRKIVGSNQIFEQLFSQNHLEEEKEIDREEFTDHIEQLFGQNHLEEEKEIDFDREEFTDHVQKLKALHAKYHGLTIDR